MKTWLLLTGLGLATALQPNHAPCSSLTNLNLGNTTTITLAHSLPAGSNFTSTSAESSYNTPQTNLPALCRVAFTVKTSSNSSAKAEVWLPEPSSWTGRFLAVGNGGFAGGVNYPDIVWGVRKGFATMSTNAGHDSSSSDGTWMLNNPEALIDFGHRALHMTTEAAKGIVKGFYGQREGWAYYAGCSTGGRQGLNAAQRYPEDYDGVLVGSAIPSQTNTSAWQVYVALEQYPNNRSSYIPASMWPAIHAAVLEQCDTLDGVQDGIIMNPLLCSFNTSVLSCNNTSNTSACLNPAQLQNLKRMYTPWTATHSPGLSPGGEASFSILMNGAEPQFGPSFYRYAVFHDSDWDWRTMDANVVRFAEEMNPGGWNAYNPDMRSFQQAGGKVMQYHGFADPLIPALVAPTWFDTLRRFYKSIRQEDEVEDFYRLFMVPGMGHCSGGVGAWVLDGASQNAVTPQSNESEYSMLWSLVDWVENSSPPKSIIGTKFVNDTASLGVDFTRPICQWPTVGQYLGGPVEEARSWECPS